MKKMKSSCSALRSAMMAAGLLIAASFWAASPAAAEDAGSATPQLPGSWVVNVTPAPEAGIPPFVNLTSFTRDGRVVNVDPIEGTAVGEWTRGQGGEHHVTFVGLAAQEGSVLHIKVRGTMILGQDGRTFSGPFRTEVLDADGTVLVTFDGIVEGTRFDAEPL